MEDCQSSPVGGGAESGTDAKTIKSSSDDELLKVEKTETHVVPEVDDNKSEPCNSSQESDVDDKPMDHVVTINTNSVDSKQSFLNKIPIEESSINAKMQKTETELSVKPKRPKSVETCEKNLEESSKPKGKRRAVELRLKNLQWTLNQPCGEVSGKRQKKAPDRFELSVNSKRKSSMDDAEGDGDPFGNIPWIVQHIKEANVYTLRLMHRVIFRKQGMFSEKHIRRSLMTFRGFPFDFSSMEIEKRKLPMEKASVAALSKFCEVLGIKSGDKSDMIHRILKFLHCPSRQQVEDYIKETASTRSPQRDPKDLFNNRFSFASMHFPRNFSTNLDGSSDSSQDGSHENKFPFPVHNIQIVPPMIPPMCNVEEQKISSKATYENNVLTVPWKKPAFFEEGTGTKLKCFKPIVVNMQIATHNFIEKLHRLLYLQVDHCGNMRRNILEFSGFSSAVGTSGYLERNKFLYELPMDQIKFICRVLCLPTWHRSRQFLIDGILNFLAAPCLSPMKKTVPPPCSSNKDFMFAAAVDMARKTMIASSAEHLEGMEIIPDIHTSINDFYTEEVQLKLKNFPNIHYQVISTPASKLNDLHMVLYGRPCPLNNIRKNILEFACFPFDERSSEYQSRKNLLENMNLDSLITVMTVLNLTQNVVDLSRQNIVHAVMKFLSKPSNMLTGGENSTLAMETSAGTMSDIEKEQNKISLQLLERAGEITIQPIKTEPSTTPVKVKPKPRDGARKRKSQPPVKFIMSPSTTIEDEEEDDFQSISNVGLDEPLAKVKKSGFFEDHFDSDDNDDKPLSKFIGHPNDDQLRILVAKILKDSKLDEITMKQVIRKVYNAYPNFELGYRKEFIKSVVRQVLSQMGDPRCCVSTTVYTF